MSRLHECFDLDCLPDEEAIYLFARRFGLRMQVLYVGKATSLRGRIKQQLNNLKLMQAIDDAAIGPRMLIYGTFNMKPGQRADVVLDIVERALIDHSAYGTFLRRCRSLYRWLHSAHRSRQ